MTYEVTNGQLAELAKIMNDLDDIVVDNHQWYMVLRLRRLIEQIEMQDVMY